MLLFLLNHKLLSGMIWILIVCGVSTQIILGVRMQRLLEEMDQISATKNSFLNKCRICPEGTSPRNHVDNMMKNYRIWGCMPATWKALSSHDVVCGFVRGGSMHRNCQGGDHRLPASLLCVLHDRSLCLFRHIGSSGCKGENGKNQRKAVCLF